MPIFKYKLVILQNKARIEYQRKKLIMCDLRNKNQHSDTYLFNI